MAEKVVKVINPIGLHARPASVLVANAVKYKEHEIRIILNENRTVDAKSILVVMSCAIEANQEFKISIKGNNSEDVLDEFIETLVQKNILVLV